MSGQSTGFSANELFKYISAWLKKYKISICCHIFSRNCQPYILRLHLYFTIIKKDNILPLGIITWAHPAFNVFLSWKVLMGSQDSSVRSHVWFLSRFTENNAVFNSEKVSPECAVPRFLKLSNNFGISLHFGRVPHN